VIVDDGIGVSKFLIEVEVLESKGFAGVVIQETDEDVIIREEEEGAKEKREFSDGGADLPPPAIKMGKISPQGRIPIEFNQAFIIPDNFESFNYSSYFEF
jgi:hypothetical protein